MGIRSRGNHRASFQGCQSTPLQWLYVPWSNGWRDGVCLFKTHSNVYFKSPSCISQRLWIWAGPARRLDWIWLHDSTNEVIGRSDDAPLGCKPELPGTFWCTAHQHRRFDCCPGHTCESKEAWNCMSDQLRAWVSSGMPTVAKMGTWLTIVSAWIMPCSNSCW